MRERVDLQAILPSPPPALPPWAKVLWYLAETVAVGVTYLQYTYSQEIAPSGGTAGGPDATIWIRWQVTFENVNSAERADDETFTFDLLNYTNGAPDSTWTAQDFNLAWPPLWTFIQAIAPYTASYLSHKETKAYAMSFNPYSNTTKPFADSGPPVWSAAAPMAGTGSALMAPQVSSSLTAVTPSRRHWGRTYLPTLGGQVFTNQGRLQASYIDALVAAYATMTTAWNTNGFYEVVPTTQVDRNPVRTLQNVTAIKADDVADIIRRRRFRSPNYFHQIPVA